jgi:hypothetical protein
MNAEGTETGIEEKEQKKKRSPLYYGGGGCLLGFLIMVCYVTVLSLVKPGLPFSGKLYSTILTVGSWVVPIGFGVLGYFYGKRKQ